jgi:hypothetical protein
VGIIDKYNYNSKRSYYELFNIIDSKGRLVWINLPQMRNIVAVIVLFSSLVNADTVTLSWTPPTERVNGNHMSTDEIGGYEVVTKCPGQTDASYIVQSVVYTLEGQGIRDCEFYVATYDTDGIYSEFVKAVGTTIRAPTRGGIR